MASLSEMREQKIPVPGLGWIMLIDWMGDDQAIVQAARLSYGKGTRSVSDDRALIRYLMRHRHTTPFEQVCIKFLIRLPMDCMRQLVRHRTARLNEYSTRYSEAIDECATTAPDAWREQAQTNRQGSGGMLPDELGQQLTDEEARFHRLARGLYATRIASGVAREQARKDLPLSTMTEIVWQMDLHNLFHFLGLRLDGHAQLEIRLYAQAIAEIVKVWCPLAWEAFTDYRLNGLTLTGPEVQALLNLMDRSGAPWSALVREALGEVNSYEGKRAGEEFAAKLKRLGFCDV